MATESKRTRRPTGRTSVSRRLAPYDRKRNLATSGEPSGGRVSAREGAVRRFVIQKHDATRLHFDFRLEMEGVYRSWAVPKGLPANPGERSLGVEVEDHPLEYGSFEGVIPAGNYGAGTVMLWDRGYYTVSGTSPEAAYRQGKIHLALTGEKCVGEWTLVRMRPRLGDRHANWLIIKNHAPAHRAAMTGRKRELSVSSGRTMDQIASGERAAAARRTRRPKEGAGRARPRSKSRRTRDDARQSTRGQRRDRTGMGARSRSGEHLAEAKFIAPMKASSVERVPPGNWRLEIKHDGYRAITVINRGEIELWSRNHKPLATEYPEVVEALRAVPCVNAVIDGEIVALDPEGRSRFQLLQNRKSGARPPIAYYVFDLLHHDGRQLIDAAIEERQMALEVLVGKGSPTLRLSPVFTVPPEKLLTEVRRRHLEGIIAKTPGSRYEPDRRSGAWLKCKVQGEQEFVIGGFTPPRNTRPFFGAILVGYRERGRLRYAGKVGTGFDQSQLADLHREFVRRQAKTCPFPELPRGRKSRDGTGMTAAEMREVTWLKPELVAQVRFSEWTEDGSLRHPVFLGLRHDKPARDVGREKYRSRPA